MSDDHSYDLDQQSEVGQDNSLSARMEQRADVLEKQQTEWFPIPGWEGILEVELRSLGYKTMSAIQHRNERVRDPGTKELYNMADQLLRATTGFRQVYADDARPPKPVDDDWTRLAQRLPTCPEAPTPRQALLFLVGEKRIHFLIADWSEWARTVRTDVDEEVREDFARTG